MPQLWQRQTKKDVLFWTRFTIAIARILHQEQEYNGKTILRPIYRIWQKVTNSHTTDSWRPEIGDVSSVLHH